MLINAKAKILVFIAALGAVAVIIGGFYTWSKNKGKAEAEAEALRRDLNTAAAEAEKAETVKKVYRDRTDTVKAEIKQNADEKRIVIESARESRIYDLNKWVVFGLIFLSVSCAPREVTVYRTTLPYQPAQEVFERPVYGGAPVSFMSDNDTVCYSEAGFDELFRFVMELKEAIKNYETQAISTNAYNDFLRELYEVGK